MFEIKNFSCYTCSWLSKEISVWGGEPSINYTKLTFNNLNSLHIVNPIYHEFNLICTIDLQLCEVPHSSSQIKFHIRIVSLCRYLWW